ncbi:ribbon-helix-helix protein, CopG family [Alkalicaulis satelles]|uniref:Ribbon-helix-helix protein, CopG family n=1 Tax=Alkalicaulis satelles TaxID=2609175 RepID=A0A5M6ZFL8_9PROT|nr:ribbon-helix-helix protein, CopG family [Alkalicaulis satelles]KAA5803519.1 ribbon-helix-helix protein, CopG family [Alkalicaulis satelles]
MKRDRTKKLKANAKLDVRLPDQLKDEFLARCREEGVSSGAVIRSLILEYLRTRPRQLSAMAASLKETMVKTHKWIAGAIGAAAAAAAGTAALLFAPMANAEDVEVGFALRISEAGQSSTASAEIRLPLGQPVMIFLEDLPLESQYGLMVQVNTCAADADERGAAASGAQTCEHVWEFEVFEAVEWRRNEHGGISVTQKRVLGTPRLASGRHAAVSFELGSVLPDGSSLGTVSGEFAVRSGA